MHRATQIITLSMSAGEVSSCDCDWDKIIMGPIFDEHGVEQGNINSSDYYKIYNNPLLEILQASKQ